MRYTIGPEFTHAELQCEPCGIRYGAEFSADEQAQLNERRFGAWLTADARRLRGIVKAQLQTKLHKLGCPHV